MPKESKWNLGPLGYLWLFVSLLLNISGLSSIVQGFVELGGFLGDIVNQYRTWIREPIRAAFSFIWIPLPWWLADWLCISASFTVAVNYFTFKDSGRTFVSKLNAEVREKVFLWLALALLALLGPLFFPFAALLELAAEKRSEELSVWDNNIRELYVVWLSILCLLVLLIFLNWQGQKLGYW